MSKIQRSRNIDTIFVLIVFSIFAISILMVLMLGASIYRNINDISHDGEFEHTALSYVWTKVKNFDNADSIYLGYFHGISALFIDEYFGGTHFRTAIFHHDGWLCEIFSQASLEFRPSDGIRIVRVDQLNFEPYIHDLIRASTGDRMILISPRSELGIPLAG